ncbi:MAG: translation initiation factor IF-5A [Candidatus Micrarchaeota archaeon]|nr:translation initiation factor IF-5A [Candidatus Micrarchaeota archaeon]
MSDDILHKSMKEIKVGSFVIVDGIPCKVVDIETSSPGKHGSAKMRVTAIGIFDGQKKTLLKPSSGDVDVPLINKRKAQVVSINGNMAQLMDSESFEIYDLQIPDELSGKVGAGAEIEVMEAMGRKMISRILSNQ